MKNMLVMAFLCAPLALFCQSETENKQVKTKLEAFTEETGTLIETTEEEIGKLGNSISIKVLKLKNLITGAKVNGILFETGSNAAFASSRKRTSLLDSDEIDGLVKSLEIMKDAVTKTRPSFTELKYKSRTGFEVGTYFDTDISTSNKTGEKKWMYYFKNSNSESKNALSPADFMALCGYIEAAKSKL